MNVVLSFHAAIITSQTSPQLHSSNITQRHYHHHNSRPHHHCSNTTPRPTAGLYKLLNTLDRHLSSCSYLEGFTLSQLDSRVLKFLQRRGLANVNTLVQFCIRSSDNNEKSTNCCKFSHIRRWFVHLLSFSDAELLVFNSSSSRLVDEGGGGGGVKAVVKECEQEDGDDNFSDEECVYKVIFNNLTYCFAIFYYIPYKARLDTEASCCAILLCFIFLAIYC